MVIGQYLSDLSPIKGFYRLQGASYMLVQGVIFKRNFDRVLLRHVDDDQASKIIQ